MINIKFPPFPMHWQFSSSRFDTANEQNERHRKALTVQLQVACEHVYHVSKVQRKEQVNASISGDVKDGQFGFVVKTSVREISNGTTYECTLCGRQYLKSELNDRRPGVRWGPMESFRYYPSIKETKSECRVIRRNDRKAKRLLRRVNAKGGILIGDLLNLNLTKCR